MKRKYKLPAKEALEIFRRFSCRRKKVVCCSELQSRSMAALG